MVGKGRFDKTRTIIGAKVAPAPVQVGLSSLIGRIKSPGVWAGLVG
jgi:hypothetical protein